MILKKIGRIYKKETTLIQSKASYLVLILFSFFLLCSYLAITTPSFYIYKDYIGYLLGAVFSFLSISFLLKGHYQWSVNLSSILFPIALAFGLLLGPLDEIKIIFIPVIIVYVLIFSSKKTAYSIIVFCFIILTAVYFAKKETQQFSEDFFLISMGVIILLFLLSLIQTMIMEEYIKEISDQNNLLEKRVEKRTEELTKSRDYAELLFQNNPLATYTTNRKLKIVDINNQMELISGYTRNELIGESLDIYRSDPKNSSNECMIKNKKGKNLYIEKFETILYDYNNKISGRIESFIDISSRKELEEFKIDIERVIRHDLKTPLNSIIGFPKMMLTDDSISDEFKEYLLIIINAGQNMLNQINISLDLYKLEEGTYEISKEETNIAAIIRQIQTESRDILKKKKCRLTMYINNSLSNPKSEIFIETEKTLLYMILLNLLNNAIEASPKHEEITIEIIEDELFTITIHNKGVIPFEIRERFFEKYVTSGKKKGNGLGTYSAKIMSLAIGAELHFKTDEKSGTTLIIYINKTFQKTSITE